MSPIIDFAHFNILHVTSLEMLVWIACEYSVQLTQQPSKLTTYNAGKVISIIFDSSEYFVPINGNLH